MKWAVLLCLAWLYMYKVVNFLNWYVEISRIWTIVAKTREQSELMLSSSLQRVQGELTASSPVALWLNSLQRVVSSPGRVTQTWKLCFSWKYDTYAYDMLGLWSHGYNISLICVIWLDLMEIMYLMLKCMIMILFWNELIIFMSWWLHSCIHMCMMSRYFSEVTKIRNILTRWLKYS